MTIIELNENTRDYINTEGIQITQTNKKEPTIIDSIIITPEELKQIVTETEKN